MDWRLKAAAQRFLSVVPLGRDLNFLLSRSFGAFRKSTSVAGVLKDGLDIIQLCCEHGLHLQGAVVMEVGTGWHPTLPLLLSCCGAARVITYDIARHITPCLALTTLRQILPMFPKVSARAGIPLATLRAWRRAVSTGAGVDTLLRSARVHYVAPGDATRTNLPSGAVDLVVTRGVLEHVPARVANRLLREAHRVLKPLGLMYHSVGLHDHYVSFDKSISMVNFLRYSDRAWSFLGQNDLQYQNRLRAPQVLQMIRDAGFRLLWHAASVDEKSLRVLRHIRVAQNFRGLAPKDLAAHKALVLAQKPRTTDNQGTAEYGSRFPERFR